MVNPHSFLSQYSTYIFAGVGTGAGAVVTMSYTSRSAEDKTRCGKCIRNVDSRFITANRNFPRSLGAKEQKRHLDKENRRELWLKEIKDAMIYEQLYLRVKVKDKQYD